MCDNPSVPYLIGTPPDGGVRFVFKADCDNWSCEQCATRKKRIWFARAVHGCNAIRSNGMDVRFITITSHKSLSSSAATIAVFPNAWGKLYQAMKREFRQLEYLLILEAHKNGRLHAHMLTNAPMRTRWYKNVCSRCGLGYMATSDLVDNDAKAIAYTAKYLGKSLEGTALPTKMRRVRASALFSPKQGDETESVAQWRTVTTKEGLWREVEACQREGVKMLNPKTGELFDYMHECETWYQ